MKKGILLLSMLGLIAIIIYFNSDFGIDVDMSSVNYSVLRFNSGRQIFDDSCGYHFVTKSDIGKTEKVIRKAFEDYNKTVDYPREHKEYGRQYMGASTPNGEILIYVNCFVRPDKYGQKWLFLVNVSDGGDDFFEGMINVTTGEIIYFGPHGSA